LKRRNKKFIYLISPNQIKHNSFFVKLNSVLKSNKVSFFQLRLKKETLKKKILIARKIKNICNRHNVKFIINDDPHFALKVNADGCHLGQKDMDIKKARINLKGKYIGVTCHNSLKLAKIAFSNGANYVAIGAFFKTSTKNVKHKANIKTLKKIKKSIKLPVVAIGGINEKNYKNLLLNKADFLAISSYIWNNKYLNPYQAVRKLI
jgi:thiamine-phosphate pyrophosphorylase